MVCAQFARLVAEGLDGQRRINQLANWFSHDCLEVLTRQRQRTQGRRVRLASVRVQPVSPTCAEVTLRLATGSMFGPGALRVSQINEQWTCTDLVLA